MDGLLLTLFGGWDRAHEVGGRVWRCKMLPPDNLVDAKRIAEQVLAMA